MSERWIRSQRAAVVEVGDDLLLIARDGSVRKLEGDSAELARASLALFARAHDEAELVAHIEMLAGPLGERTRVVRELFALLCDSGALEIAREAAPGMAGPRGPTAHGGVAAVARGGLNVVVAISGAIAASYAPALISALQRRGHTVEVALTPTAMRFVSVDAIAALTQREPHTSMWPRAAHVPVPHIALATWADLVIVYPASATTIARIATGDFSDLVSAIALTTRGAVVIAPSMNIDMLEAPAVQRNLEQLREDGFAIVHGVPSQEVADAPSTRTTLGGAAPAPGELATTLDVLHDAGALPRRDHSVRASTSAAWDAAYRQQLVPWASDSCDADIAGALAEHAPPPGAAASSSLTGTAANSSHTGATASTTQTSVARRLLDIGCGLGQVARHAADIGYRVVATDIAETALVAARDIAETALVAARDIAATRDTPGTRDAASALDTAGPHDITWLRDDICATALLGPFDVIVDRATLHTLPRTRAYAWAAAIRKLAGPGATVIVKAHRAGIPGATFGYTAAELAQLLPGFTLVAERDAELPGITDDTPIASTLFVLRRA